MGFSWQIPVQGTRRPLSWQGTVCVRPCSLWNIWCFSKKTCKPEDSGVTVGGYLGDANLGQGDLAGRLSIWDRYACNWLWDPNLVFGRSFCLSPAWMAGDFWGWIQGRCLSAGAVLAFSQNHVERCEGKGSLSSGLSLGCKPLCHPHQKMSVLSPELPLLCTSPACALSMYRKLLWIPMGRQGSAPRQKDFPAPAPQHSFSQNLESQFNATMKPEKSHFSDP